MLPYWPYWVVLLVHVIPVILPIKSGILLGVSLLFSLVFSCRFFVIISADLGFLSNVMDLLCVRMSSF